MVEGAAREVNLCPKTCNREECLQMQAAELYHLCVGYTWNVALRVQADKSQKVTPDVML
jgi:hypothetical protein